MACSSIIRTSLLPLLFLAASGAHAQNPVYKCGDTHVYTDMLCEDNKLVDLKQSDNILQPGPTYVAPAAPKETPKGPVIWPNSSRIVSTPPAGPSSIWSQRDARSATPLSASPPARAAGNAPN